MCGIIGYIGSQQALPIILEGLRRLEYRGYDSAGIATIHDGKLHVCKVVGNVDALERKLETRSLPGTIGIGHVRWATHGKKSEENAHPQLSMDGKIALVHNGVIRRHVELRKLLVSEGFHFAGETDTELLAHLTQLQLQWQAKEDSTICDLVSGLSSAVLNAKESYAVAAISPEYPDTIAFARWGQELVIGYGKQEMFVASDVEALRGFAHSFVRLKDLEFGSISGTSAFILPNVDLESRIQPVPKAHVIGNKNVYPHFMIKEVMEQPEVLRRIIGENGFLEPPLLVLPQSITKALNEGKSRVIIAGCGTSYHAALVGELLMEQADIPAKVVQTSNWTCYAPVITEDTLIIGISQSGETADTLRYLQHVKAWKEYLAGLTIFGITNREGSTLWELADLPIDLKAGPEFAVAATKSFIAQIAALYHIFASIRSKAADAKDVWSNLLPASSLVEEAIRIGEPAAQSLARKYAEKNRWIFIGEGFGYPLALEGALKLKEVAYVDAHGMPAGELKHGTLALIEEGVPVVAILPPKGLRERMLSSISEVLARGGDIIALAQADDAEVQELSDNVHILPAPNCTDELIPISAAPALQLLAYYAALVRGINPDQPRNLAKSVTVE